ncbi:g2548 [Coccomyxa viridis]|uniref:G2548 protein n=1 Tax=Coccomyxa viridis TaxID=1274662 RepID=A0ABP1FKN2_9CHLO
MDKFGISGAILSVSSPGTAFGDLSKARSMARQVNEYTAKIVSQYPERFGFFAFLPMPDLDASIEEARYALDVLKADGVVLLGNARGKYFSEPEFHPLLKELNSRKTVIFVHPNYLPGPQVPGLPPFVADFLLDTVRAATLYVTTGAAAEYKDLELILAHAGAFIPYVASRIGMAATAIGGGGLAQAGVSDASIEPLKRFYVDTALSTSPYAFPSLLTFTDPSHITFGSDFPFAPDAVGAYFAGELDKQFSNDTAALAQINSGTAAELFPRFSKQCMAGAAMGRDEL